MDKPSVGNGVPGRDAGSRLPRMFGEAKTHRAHRAKSAGVRSWRFSEGYRYVTWYHLLFLVSLSILGVAGLLFSSIRPSISTTWSPGASSIAQKIMYRLGWLPALAISTCVVLGNETVVNKTFDVFDYVDPLIGTINGGPFSAVIVGLLLTRTTGHVFPGATLPFGEGTISISAKRC